MVNSDKGTKIDGELVNYASRMISSLDENFVMTNLETARKGIEKGDYAAYLLIPSNFSESLVSLNTSPVQARIEYAMNPNLHDAYKADTLSDIMDFENTLNNSMSYMYVSTILANFHQGQDGAGQVLNNDSKEKETVAAIQPSDMLAMVEVPSISMDYTATEPLDIAGYSSKNQDLVKTIGDRYAYFLSLNDGEVEALKEHGISLNTDFTQLDEWLKKIDLTKEEDGQKTTYADGLQKMQLFLEGYRDKVLNLKYKDIKRELETIDSNILSVEEELADSVSEYNHDLDIRKEMIVSDIQKIPMPCVKAGREEGSLQIADEDIEIFSINTDGLSLKEEVDNSLEKVKGLHRHIDRLEKIIEGSQDPETALKYENYLSSPSYEEYIEADNLEQAMRVSQVNVPLVRDIKELQSDINEALERGYTKGINQKSIMKILDKNLMQYMALSGVRYKDDDGNALEDECGNPFYKSLHTLLEEERERIAKNKESVSSISPMDAEALSRLVEADIIEPMNRRVLQIGADLSSKYDIQKSKVENIQKGLAEFRPMDKIDRAEIDGYLASMGRNNTDIQTSVYENYSAQTEHTGKLISSARENVSHMQKSIQDAQAASNEAVTQGLGAFKSMKEKNSAENQLLLGDFIDKLPYTRLGELENTQTYRFISDPVALAKVSEKEKRSNAIADKDLSDEKDINGGEDKQKTRLPLYILLFVGIVLATAGVISSLIAAKQRKGDDKTIS